MVSDKAVVAAAVVVVVGAGAGAALYLSRQVKAAGQVASVALMADPTSGPAPLHVELSGSALDVAGNGVPGATLKVLVNGQGGFLPVTTDKLGNFDTALGFSVAGTYEVALQVGSVTSNRVTVTVTAVPPPPPPPPSGLATISLAADKTTVAPNEAVTLTGRGLDSSGNGVATTLYLYVNGAIAQSTATDSSGNYAFRVTFQQAGSYTVFVADA